MTQDQLLCGLKKDLRSLLISAKHGLSPEQLKRDYHNMLGQPLPFKTLGFRHVLDMVKEMPDVVQLDYAVDGSILLKAIGDESTKGIEELISKQRNHKSSKSSARKAGLGGFSSRFPSLQYPLVLPRRSHAPLTIPAQLRSQLRQLLSYGPVRLSELETRYAACFGRPLLVTQYGFYSIAEMLAAASDLIAVRQSRTGSQLILKVAVTPVRHTLAFTAMPSKRPARIFNLSTSSDIQKEKSILSNIENPKNVNSPKQEETVIAGQAKHPGPVPESGRKEESFEKSVAKLEEELKQRILENGEAGAVSQDLKDKLRRVVAGHSQGLAIPDLPSAYKKMYGEDLPVAQCGFLSVTEMVGALTDTFYLQPGPKHGANHLLIMELKQNGTQPASSQSEGGVCAESLNPSSEGHYFTCSESAWERENKTGESTDSSESDAEVSIADKTTHQIVTMFPVAMVGCAGVSAVPLDALRCQKLKPPTRRMERELVPVLVEWTKSPSHFCVRFSENQEARTLENMIFEMRSCYTCPEVTERYRLPDAHVRPGQVCCVAPRDAWFYRVVIHRVLSTSQVEVYYVDFGDLGTVDRKSLRFLKSCYAELPAQAVPSVLVGVKPHKGIWTKDATNSFQKLCYDRTLVAAVHSYREDILLLFLCDTHSDEDTYIHKALQAEGHAIACSPATTPMFWQFNPVTLYFGEGQLEEVKEHTTNGTLSAGVPNEHSSERRPPPLHSTIQTEVAGDQQPSEGADGLLDLPELESIDTDLGEKANPFGALVKSHLPTFSNWDHGWMDQNNAGDVSPEPVRESRKESAKAATASSAVSVSAEAQPLGERVRESDQTQEPVSTVRALSLHTPGLICNSDLTDLCSEERSHRPSTSLMYPSCFPNPGVVLGPGSLFLQQASSLGLGPAARMAACSVLLHWQAHKRASARP